MRVAFQISVWMAAGVQDLMQEPTHQDSVVEDLVHWQSLWWATLPFHDLKQPLELLLAELSR